jgi:hypothetical protein
MADALDRLFEDMRAGLIDAVHFAGPWALPALGVFAVLLAVVFRDRIVSPGGLIFLLAILVMAVVIKAAQLGRL